MFWLSAIETQSVTPEQGRTLFQEDETWDRTRPLLMGDIRQKEGKKKHSSYVSKYCSMFSTAPRSHMLICELNVWQQRAWNSSYFFSLANENIMKGWRNVVAVYLDCPVLSRREAVAKFAGLLWGLQKTVTHHETWLSADGNVERRDPGQAWRGSAYLNPSLRTYSSFFSTRAASEPQFLRRH